MAGVPRLFPDSTIVCLASGQSLTRGDVEYCRERAPVVAVSDTYKWAPWASSLYACDAKWWTTHHGVPSFAGMKFALDRAADRWPGVTILSNEGDTGIEVNPSGVRTGKNSGYQAINVAIHLGAKRIVLLGYDMQVKAGQPTHFFGDHPYPLHRESPFELFLELFATMVEPAKALGVEIVNCSRETALEMFPRRALADVL